MKVKFVNGVIKGCSSPTEQKIFKQNSNESGWILNLRLIGEITSTEIDELLNVTNVARLEFLSDSEEPIFTLDGYNKITASTIRHAEDTTATSVDIQMTKGL